MIDSSDIIETKIKELIKELESNGYEFDDRYTSEGDYLDDVLGDVDVDGNFVRGVAEQGPGYDHGGQPAEPAFFEDITVTIDKLDITEFITDKCIENLNDHLLEGQ